MLFASFLHKGTSNSWSLSSLPVFNCKEMMIISYPSTRKRKNVKYQLEVEIYIDKCKLLYAQVHALCIYACVMYNRLYVYVHVYECQYVNVFFMIRLRLFVWIGLATFLRNPPFLYEQAQSGLMEDGSLSQPHGPSRGLRDERAQPRSAKLNLTWCSLKIHEGVPLTPDTSAIWARLTLLIRRITS